ncbi:MAG: hypothetical protein WC787_01050 [Patescibacteria group bacterium]|jgi:hypothetical protein
MTTQEIFYLVASIALGGVAIFLCWALYEVATLLRKANTVVTETQEKIVRIERGVMAVKERLESSVGYLGILAEGGKAMLGMLQSRWKDRGEEDEDEEDPKPRKKKKSQLFEDAGMNE